MSVGKFAFLPNLRSAAAADARLEGVRPSLSYDLEITGNGTAQGARIPVSAILKGPGDVVGLDPAQVVRVEPEAADKGFEPNYFPFLELKDPDLPWRYTLDSGTKNRLTPWMVLIALKDDEFGYLDQGRALAPRIEVLSVRHSLPDLDQAWATAHVQVDMEGMSGTAADVVLADPGRGFARLFACRKLEASTRYTLFVVPSYSAGRMAALGEGVDAAAGRAMAWDSADTGARVLPYFYRHRFKTESGQDLEALLRKLRAIRADEEGEAGAPLWVSGENVGYYKDIDTQGYIFPAQAALAQPDTDIPAMDTPEKLRRSMATTLDSVLGEAEDKDTAEDPLLTFPAYGYPYAGAGRMSIPQAVGGAWFDRLNLDLKFRAAAGLGQAIVRQNDEHFSQLCWEQYDEVLAANEALGRLQVASMLAGRMERRHFSKLPGETGIQLSKPLMGFVRENPDDDRAKSLKLALSERNVPDGFSSLDLRRTASRKPTRMAPRRKGGAPQRRVPVAALPGDKTPGEKAVARADGALGQRAAALADSKARNEITKALRGMFNPEMLGRKPKPRVPRAVVGSYASQRITRLVGDKLRALPRQKADHLIRGRSQAEVEDGGIIYRTPRLPEPLIDYLMRINRDAVLSNAAALPENTVSVYEENRHFVEAVMVGANHAMNEELRWREYPTDMRGTIFHRFWNRGGEPDDKSSDDITEIRDWSAKLGKNPAPADVDGKANLVVVIKGEAVRKLNTPLVVLSIADKPEWDPERSTDYAPVFFGKIGRDAVYFGFDISRDYLLSEAVRDRAFFVIYEPPARLRFGLDVGTANIRAKRPASPDLVLGKAPPPLESWNDLSWSHMRLDPAQYLDFSYSFPKPPDEPENYWNSRKHAAGIARSFWQKPLAAVLPLARVL